MKTPLQKIKLIEEKAEKLGLSKLVELSFSGINSKNKGFTLIKRTNFNRFVNIGLNKRFYRLKRYINLLK